jgi:hypothetical protein
MTIGVSISVCLQNQKPPIDAMRFSLAIIAAAVVIPVATAQIRGAGSSTGFGISSGGAGISRGGLGSSPTTGLPGHGNGTSNGHFHAGHGSGGRGVFFSYPYLYPDSDEGYASQQSSQPQVVVVPASAPVPPAVPPSPRESLLIEWQGDHFVRTRMSAATSTGGEIAPDYSEKPVSSSTSSSRSKPVAAPQPARELPPAVLVFRDGRREEVSEHTIMNGTIYSKADYWTTGSWDRKIQIADLDVPATLKLNQDRGLKFVLPSSSNEVIIRP